MRKHLKNRRESTCGSVQRSGLTLIELLVFLVVMAIAMTAALSMFISSRMSERQGEERRRASLAAEQKMDEIRAFIRAGNPLDKVWESYGPTPPATATNLPWLATTPPGMLAADVRKTFDATYIATISQQSALLTGLDPYYDTNPADGTRTNPRAIVTVAIINDETPFEAQFGYDYNNGSITSAAGGVTVTPPSPPFGVDLNGNGSRLIQTGFSTNVSAGTGGAAGYNNQTPLPFPLDLNGNGNTTDSNVTANFVMLPVVVSIQWQGAAGPQRYDLFTIIMLE